MLLLPCAKSRLRSNAQLFQQVALDHMASAQEDFATIITEELLNYSSQIQEEISIIDKRLLNEGTKQFALMREHIGLFESRLREREKIKDKLLVSGSSITVTGRWDVATVG
jgi:hypothetical protein